MFHLARISADTLNKKLKRVGAIVAAGLMTAVVVSSGIIAPLSSASALNKTADLEPSSMARSYAYTMALKTCLQRAMYKNSAVGVILGTGAWPGPASMSQVDATKYDWFSGVRWIGGAYAPIPPTMIGVTITNGINVGAFNDPRGTSGDGSQNCGDSEGRAWIKKLMELYDYEPVDFLCNVLKFTRATGAAANTAACREIVDGANNDFIPPANPAQNLMDFWTSKLGNDSTGVESIGPGEWWLYWLNFESQCFPSESGTLYKLKDFRSGEMKDSSFGAGSSDRGEGHGVWIYEGKSMNCRELVNAIDEAPDDQGNGGDRAVRAMIKWLNDGNKLGENIDPGGGDCLVNPDACEDGKTTCAINGIGWAICPIVTFAGEITDDLFQFLADSFLAIDIGILDPTGVNNGTYQAWVAMRNIANVCFVIAFLIIIFSQLSSVGVTNYGVKKLLPRLVIAALLVNLSFYVCQIAVDLSNLAGYGLKQFLDGLSNNIITNVIEASGNNFEDVNGTEGFNGWSPLIALVLAGGAAGIIYVQLGALIALLLAALVSILVIFFILLIRQMLVILLIVVSPLAFVAFLLPNTENLFKMWRKAFTSLLLVFPIVGLVFGASALASSILKSSYVGLGGDDTVSQIIAAGTLFVPLIAVPFILKGSLNGIGNLGSMINNLGSRAGKGLGGAGSKAFGNSRLGKFQEYRKGQAERRRAQILGGTYQGSNRNPLNWGRNLRSAASRKVFNPMSGHYGSRVTAQGESIADADDAELMKFADSRVGNMKFTGTDGVERPLSTRQLIQLGTGQDVTDDSGRVVAKAGSFDEHARRSAVLRAAAVANVSEAHQLLDASTGMSAIERKTLSQGLRTSSAAGKAPWLSGKTLGLIEQGGITAAEAALRAIDDGKVTPEALAAGDEASVAHLVSTVAAMPAGPDKARYGRLLKNAYTGLMTGDPAMRAKVTQGSKHATALGTIAGLPG